MGGVAEGDIATSAPLTANDNAIEKATVGMCHSIGRGPGAWAGRWQEQRLRTS